MIDRQKINSFLKRAYWTLDGWRFQDLKNFITLEAKNHNAHQNVVDNSLTIFSIQQLSDGKDNSFALLSVMPPTESGVGVCNLKTIVEGSFEGDVFGDWNSAAAWLQSAAYHDTRLLSRYGISALPFFLYRRKYKNVVASFGNSDSDFEIIDLAIKCQAELFCDKFSIHLHDMCLWNICRMLSVAQGKSLLNLIIEHYPQSNNEQVRSVFASNTTNWQISEALIDLGLYGLKPILANLNPNTVFVNSEAASCILDLDYKDSEKPFIVKRAFHPIFRNDVRKIERPVWNKLTPLRIGTFGILSLAKRSELIFEACEKLVDQGQNITLVVAGYGAKSFIEKNNLYSSKFQIEVYSSPTDGELLSLMDSIHVAVQLRKRNLGESSGVVASLIRKYVTTIVSDIGSFAEYGGAVIAINQFCTAIELASSISGAATTDISAAQAEYAAQHSSEELCKLWFS